MGASCHSLRFLSLLLFLFSKDKGKRRRRRFQLCVGLRLWLWSADILKYFLGTPSPELPLGIYVFSKMKTVSSGAERSGCSGPACHVRTVSSTCSRESGWLASFLSDLRLHSVSASKLATSRILDND